MTAKAVGALLCAAFGIGFLAAAGHWITNGKLWLTGLDVGLAVIYFITYAKWVGR